MLYRHLYIFLTTIMFPTIDTYEVAIYQSTLHLYSRPPDRFKLLGTIWSDKTITL